ncbi:MAG TPA: alpha/beta hydrolase [Candidatus Baltobacteraceae bacterium]|nr:alpha/beta hydrolase [Candidatus Baltobacteraceae bacterium]
MKRVLSVALAAAIIALCSFPAGAARLTQAEVAPYVRPQRMVDAGGHKLNLYCTGHGAPAVILDAGEADTTHVWRKVQPRIAAFTRVCSYDRAGMGFSEGGPLPRDANAIVTDLHRVLQRAGIAPPYVLVAHSIAGLYAPLYADRYRQDVAGMVLVDPSFANQTEVLEAVSPTLKRLDRAAPGAYRMCYEAALHHDLNQGADKYAMCGFPAHAAAVTKAQCAKGGPALCELLHAQIAQIRRPAFWLNLGSEDAAARGVDSAQVLKEQRSYGAMPLIVLTAANDSGPRLPFPPAEMRAIERAWTAAHDRIARLSSIGTNFVVRRSEHYIQLDRPTVVISAINEVVTQARHSH